MESRYDCHCRWTVWDSICDADCYGDLDGNTSTISDSVVSSSDYPVIDSDYYDR